MEEEASCDLDPAAKLVKVRDGSGLETCAERADVRPKRPTAAADDRDVMERSMLAVRKARIGKPSASNTLVECVGRVALMMERAQGDDDK